MPDNITFRLTKIG